MYVPNKRKGGQSYQKNKKTKKQLNYRRALEQTNVAMVMLKNRNRRHKNEKKNPKSHEDKTIFQWMNAFLYYLIIYYSLPIVVRSSWSSQHATLVRSSELRM